MFICKRLVCSDKRFLFIFYKGYRQENANVQREAYFSELYLKQGTAQLITVCLNP